jgi:hypothetical protein
MVNKITFKFDGNHFQSIGEIKNSEELHSREFDKNSRPYECKELHTPKTKTMHIILLRDPINKFSVCRRNIYRHFTNSASQSKS